MDEEPESWKDIGREWWDHPTIFGICINDEHLDGEEHAAVHHHDPVLWLLGKFFHQDAATHQSEDAADET